MGDCRRWPTTTRPSGVEARAQAPRRRPTRSLTVAVFSCGICTPPLAGSRRSPSTSPRWRPGLSALPRPYRRDAVSAPDVRRPDSLVEAVTQPCQALLPELIVGCGPVAHHPQRSGVELVDAVAAFCSP